jgi:hypothetical protein
MVVGGRNRSTVLVVEMDERERDVQESLRFLFTRFFIFGCQHQ